MDTTGSATPYAQPAPGSGLSSQNGHSVLLQDIPAAAGAQEGGQVGEAGSLQPSNGGLQDHQSATPAAAPEHSAQEQPQNDSPQLEEFERELKKAQDNPSDFNQWVAVEKLVDKLGDIERTRRVYDGLLAEFPLCFGYWRKYADAEHKLSSPEWATNVFDRGVAAVPYSVDLWGYYCNYKQKLGVGPDEMRQLFEQGIAYVGTDFMAHGLWDKYIKYESSQGAFANVARLYLRILGCPLKEIDRYYDSLKQFAEERPTLDLMTAEDHSSIADSLRQAQEAAKAATAANPVANVTKPDASGDVDGLAHMETEDASTGGEAAAAASVNPGEKPDSAMEAADDKISEADVKAHWLLGVEALYKETKAELEQRRVFEDAIKRPYFHVKPLDQNQLSAWSLYIDYVLKKADAGIIVRLFERCLVACASYPEFWVRYVRYLEESDPESARGAVDRAAQVHCKGNATFHLYAAKFQERKGDVAAARDSYRKVLTQLAPGLTEAVVQYASFERRHKEEGAARKAFEDALAVEEANEGTPDKGAILAMFYAHYLHLSCRDSAAARVVYQRALQRWSGLRYLWEGAIHFEEHCLEPERTDRILGLYRRATEAGTESVASDATSPRPELSYDDAEELSRQFVDFADAWLDPVAAEKVSATHDSRFSKHAKLALSRKRAAEGSAGEEAALKRSSTDPAALGVLLNGTDATGPSASGAYQDPSAAYQQPATSGATSAAQAAYYPTSSAAYSYGYYQYPQQYGYSYPGY